MTEKLTGVCGEKISWELDLSTGIMTISGEGPMTDYYEDIKAPWFEQREEIKELIVSEGVTTIGEYAFFKCENLGKLTLPATVDVLGYRAFGFCKALKEVDLPEGVRIIESRCFDMCEGIEIIRLPLSLRAIDIIGFHGTVNLKEVYYAGTEESWNRMRLSQIFIEDGNNLVYDAERHYGGMFDENREPEYADILWHREKKEIVPVLDMAGEIVKKGGDGKLHFVAPEIRCDGIAHKTGDVTLVIFPDGQLMLIDAGLGLIKDKVITALKRMNVTSLDYIATSHGHRDHIENYPAVVDYILGQGGKIGPVYAISREIGQFEPDIYAYMREKGIEFRQRTVAGDQLNIGGVTIDFMGPTAEHVENLDTSKKNAALMNNISLVMKFTFGKSTYMSAGDLYRPQERKVVAAYGDQLKADVMKANHHGHGTSNSEDWLQAVSPKFVLSETCEYGGSVLFEKLYRRGIPYFCTGLNGSTMITMDKDGNIDVKSEYGETWENRVNH